MYLIQSPPCPVRHYSKLCDYSGNILRAPLIQCGPNQPLVCFFESVILETMLNNKGSVIVTGAASGLGQSVYFALVSQGISFTGLDWQPGPASIRLDYSLCDVTSQEQVQQAVDVAKQRWGPPRIVVNCAGIGRSARVLGRSGLHDRIFRAGHSGQSTGHLQRPASVVRADATVAGDGQRRSRYCCQHRVDRSIRRTGRASSICSIEGWDDGLRMPVQ